MSTSLINRKIKHLNLEIIHNRKDAYSYFLDLTSGNQVGESVMVCYLNQLTLEEWVQEAKSAKENSCDKGLYSDQTRL